MDTNTSKQTGNTAVNTGIPVYISYADNSNEKPEWEHVADGVDDLKMALESANIEYRTRDGLPCDKLTDFERQIGESEVIVIVFSDRYFRLEHCMYELVEIKKSLRKNHDKKIFCIKSGSFNLSDVNYILELEHFWGDKRQEYGEIDFHQMRQHTEQEVAAKVNDFYIDDIRHLYSFFSAMNYQNMAAVAWKSFVDDINSYYADHGTIAKLTHMLKKFFNKELTTAVKMYFIGTVSAIVLIIIMTMIQFKAQNHVIEFPVCSQNDYAQEGGILTQITFGDDSTVLRFIFPCDSIPFSGDINKMKLIEYNNDNTKYEYELMSVTPEHSVNGDDSTVTCYGGTSSCFLLSFNASNIYNNNILCFMDGDKKVNGIKINPTPIVTVQHPEYERGSDNCYISKIELDNETTKMYFRIVNASASDSTVYASDDAYILAKGQKYYMSDAAGIPIYPNRTKLAKGASMECAMTFPPIPTDTEFIHFVYGDHGIFGLKLQRQHLKEVAEPESQNKNANLTVTKIEVNKDETILHFRYFNTPGGGLTRHTPHNSYIVAGHNKYKLKGTSGLPTMPDSTVATLDFALFYPPIPAETKKLDCMIYEDFDDKEFVGFYDLKL